MAGMISTMLNSGGADLRRRLLAIYAVLIGGARDAGLRRLRYRSRPDGRRARSKE